MAGQAPGLWMPIPFCFYRYYLSPRTRMMENTCTYVYTSSAPAHVADASTPIGSHPGPVAQQGLSIIVQALVLVLVLVKEIWEIQRS